MAKSSKSQQKDLRNKLLLQAALVIFSTFIIVYFMPHSDEFGYDYSVGKPWRYNPLIAQYKFPIYKGDAVMKHEKDSVMKTFLPYFEKDKDVRNQMHDSLHTKTIEEWNGPNASLYIHHISALLDTVYSRGVMSVVDYTYITDNEFPGIRLVERNEATSIPHRRYFSTRSAYEYIINADTTKFSRVVLRHFNINDLLIPNLRRDYAKTKIELEDMMSGVSGASGIVQSGQKIIDRGEIVTDQTFAILKSYEKESMKHKNVDTLAPYSTIGQIVFVGGLLIVLISYLAMFRKDYFDKKRCAIMLFALITVFSVLASLMVKHNFFHISMLPICMVPIIIRVFLDSRTAFMFHCATVLVISFVVRDQFEYLIMQITAGMIAIQTLRELTQRSQIIKTAGIIGFSYIIIYICVVLITTNNAEGVERTMYTYLVINSVLLIFTYPLLYLLEKGFGFTSDVTLVELNNINNPLLQKMTEIAPGTFQHSMQVANLASEVAKKIGAKSQLVRTGAMYHDIGKMERPVFFTENQNGISPHKHLSPQKSADVIIAHVANGIALANKYNLPTSIKNFIQTHHGTGMTRYFFVTYKNEHPEEDVDEALFCYPGPNPSTKEEAILMMADAVEAASRSLAEYTEDSISALVDKIVDGQVTEGYFKECDITFRDIAVAKTVFKEKLKIVYHTRISYPELNNEKTNVQQ